VNTLAELWRLFVEKAEYEEFFCGCENSQQMCVLLRDRDLDMLSGVAHPWHYAGMVKLFFGLKNNRIDSSSKIGAKRKHPSHLTD
jgi:hypothetical protein